MIWIYLIFTLSIIIGSAFTILLLFDLFFKFFGKKIKADVIHYEIKEKSILENGKYSLFSLDIQYKYVFNSIEYTSNKVNSFSEFTTESKNDIIHAINIQDNQIEIYIIPNFPQFAISHPLSVNKKILFIGLISGVAFPIFLGYLILNNKNVFDLMSFLYE